MILLIVNGAHPSITRGKHRNSCHKENFRDTYLHLLNLSKYCSVAHGLVNFKNWKFAEPESSLLQTFPVDDEKENYIREVKNAVFSIVHPVPLKTGLRLAALSTDALINILNIDPSSCNGSSFIEFAAGSRIAPNSIPLSHRYGGHQVQLLDTNFK